MKLTDLVVGQGRGEVVRMEVSPSLHVCDADALTTLDGHPTLTRMIGLPTNLPVTVGIVGILYSGYRLLSTACTGQCKEWRVWGGQIQRLDT